MVFQKTNNIMSWKPEVFCSRIIHFLAQGVLAKMLKGYNYTAILCNVFIILILAGKLEP